MDPHQGPQRQWHFHHRAQNRCDPDRALHMATVAATVKAEKMLWQRDDIELKQRTLPDVAIYASDGVTTVIEVVVSHDLEDKTREVYKQAAIPVYRVYPDWQTLPELQHAASARDTLNTPSPWCTDCQQRDEQDAKQQAEQAHEQQAKLAECDLMARFVSELHIPGLPRAVQSRGICVDIGPDDCIIGIFTGVDMPGEGPTPTGAGPRWNFEDPTTGVGICVAIWPSKLRAHAHRHLIGQACILTCWQEGVSRTGGRNFRFKLEASPW